MNITIDLESLQDDDGNFAEPVVKAVETVTGQKFPDVVEGAKKNAKPKVPPGDPVKWSRDVKLKFIEDNRDNPNAYKEAINNYKQKE